MNEANRILRRIISLFLVLTLVFPFMPQMDLKVHAAVSGTLTGLSNEDIIATYTGTDDGANSSWAVTGGNSINGSVIGTAGACNDSHYNTTLTLTNNKPTAAILSFDYAIAQNSGSIQVAGTTVTANGSYSGTIEAGSSINIYIGSGSTANATTIDITNLFLIADVPATTTFQPSENGSYTVDGIQITEETVKTQQSTIAYALSATANAGYKFVGWYSVTDDKYLSSDEEASLYIDSDQTITAKFTEESNPVFDVGGAKFTDLNEADNYASSNGIEKITLVSDGILASGDYTISDGVILLIPFDDAYTCYTTAPATTGNVRTSPSVYKRLTMDEGASITVNGAISVSAKHYAYSQGGASGAPDGKYGYIFMNEGSNITINNGGAFYVYGFVSGDGTVTAKSGATVYENMQIADFRGGSATMGMYNNAQKIFPLNQYFVQNIETKLILESGADEYIYTSIYASNMSTSTAVHFIGNTDAMFSVSEGGSFTKEYLPDQDRLEVTVNGDARINSLTLSLSGMSVTSANYVLPINNCMTLNVVSGTTQITQDMAMLAGSQLNIAEEATVQVTQGSSLYVYDSAEWTQANYASNAKFKRAPYSPTRTYTRTNNDLTDVRIDINGTLLSDGSVYTTAGGADIISSQGTGKFILTNGAGTNTATYMYKDYTTDYDTIPITSAKLHNGEQYAGTEEEFTLTDEALAGSTYYWNTSDSKWKLQGEAEEVTVTFIVNGGEGSMDDQSIESGIDTVLNTNTFTREGYTFTGWNTSEDGTGTAYADGATVNLNTNLVLYAQWSANSYTVTWINDDGTELEVDQNVAYGTLPEYNSETPVKEGNDQYSYTFAGWTPEITQVTGDVTYKAVYNENVNQYTITWKNWDGSVLSQDTVNYGEVPVYSGNQPTREGDSEHSYTFAGWTPEITAVTGNAEYTAVFTENINSYTVIWQNWDGTELERDENVAYGSTPEYNGSTPTKEGDAQYSYTFTGWSPEADTVTGDITYTAVYSQSVNQYTVTWMNGESIIKTEQIAYGETPIYSGETPVKEGNAQYSYTFAGWTPEITSVVGNVTYYAVFEETVNNYTVKWVNDDGSVLETDENVPYGTAPEYNGSTPEKEAEAEKSYVFKGWNPEITADTVVTGDITFTAVYEETVNTYTVKWANEDGTILETDENAAYGSIPEYNGITPTKDSDDDYTYSFSGWTPEISPVTGDITYTATFTAVPIVRHTVTFDANSGEGTMEDQVFIQGSDTQLNKNTFTKEGYQFIGWNTSADGSGATYADEGSIINLTEDVTLYAQWQIWDGWLTDDNGKLYYQDGEIQKQGWAEIDGEQYYLDPETGYAALNGLFWLPYPDGYQADQWDMENNENYAAYGYDTNSYFIFDVSGVFQSDLNGLYTIEEGTPVHSKDDSIYNMENSLVVWAVNGELPWHPGLVYDGTDYYYFPTNYFEDGNNDTMITDTDYYVSKSNNLAWPESWGEGTFVTGTYSFDTDGKLLLRDGFTEVGTTTYYYVKGAKTYAGLIEIDGDYYYINSSCIMVKDCEYAISKTNGLLPAGTYEFGPDGKMVREDSTLNGIVKEENGTWYYYINGVKTYAGLIQIDGDYYYVNSNFEVIHDCDYYISKTNGLLERKTYTFDSEGKLVFPDEQLNGIVKGEDGTWYYYENGLKTYAGLIQIDGDYYYVNSSCEVIHDCDYYISKTNDLLPQNTYTFDSDGKLVLPDEVLNGIVKEEDGTWYYYVDGVKTYAGLIEIDGDFYYVNSSCRVIHDQTYAISKTNGLMPQGYYEFDSEGKMVTEDKSLNGIVKESDDVWYYYVDGVKIYAGLIEIDGDYYYVNSSYQVIHNQSYYISKTNGLLPNATYQFDEEGRLIQ